MRWISEEANLRVRESCADVGSNNPAIQIGRNVETPASQL